MEHMYEYDPQRKQYRKRSPGGRAAGAEASRVSTRASGDIYARSNSPANPGSRTSGTPAPRKKFPVGRIVFWVVFTLILAGWLVYLVDGLKHFGGGDTAPGWLDRLGLR